ncbi:stage II sporulation protein M [Altererythrobacter aquiaggeris]|uniref:stage II sporulation protein M n=1 Tax=Aestuarierythrobacter aquiaggeris TaxID=1898396 RepID=UPI003015C8EC
MAFPNPFARKEVVPPADIEAAALRSDRFRLEREADWRRLDKILWQMESGKMRRLPDADVLDLPVLYRTAASSLSVARETSLDSSVTAYLEALVRRAWFQIYGPRTGFINWLSGFLGGGWSRSVREIWLEICIALAVMAAGTAVGWLLAARSTGWYHALVPAQFADTRVPGASREQLLEGLAGQDTAAGLSAFSAMLFNNNARVAILAFALGFAFGIPSVMLLVHNMAVLGAMLWLFSTQDLVPEFAAWLSVHGTTELFAILLSGAAGMHIGRSMAFPGKRTIMSAASEAGRRAAVVMIGVVFMMVIAGLLEAFGRELVTDMRARYAIGAAMLLFWMLYFLAAGRGKPAGAP